MKLNFQSNSLLLLLFVLLKFWLQYHLVTSEYGLHRDEFLHLDQGQHLDWGYVSVPPLTAWFSYIVYILGNSVFWVKFFPALFGALTMVVVWKTIDALKGNRFALILGAVSILFSVLLRMNILFQPNSLDILLWTCFYYTIVQYIKTENKNWLYGAGVAFAFGFLNKYNIIFLILGLLPAMLLTSHRKVFANKHFYFALLPALLIVLPNLLWQFQHNFPVIWHMKELQETQLENVDMADFIKEQILFFLGCFFVMIIGFVGFWKYKPFKEYRVFFWVFVFTMGIFVFFKAKAYYTLGLYPIIIAFGAVYTEVLLQKKWLKCLKPVAILIPTLLFIPMYQLAFPNVSPMHIKNNPERYQKLGMLEWEDGEEHDLPQDFADMLGWEELAQKTDKALNTVENTEKTLIVCDNYGQAGAVNFYSKNKSVSAVSFNADYVNWFPLEKKIETIIWVKEAQNKEETMEIGKKRFNNIVVFDSIENQFAREKGTTIFILKNAKVDINALLKKWIAESKE
ncbi:MAG: glycosyltransferase family 39 protein [Bacteroidota bacterium]